ncbi:MAG: helix-turn-helix transcriptional regulator [Egibacteraceae bacterium]
MTVSQYANLMPSARAGGLVGRREELDALEGAVEGLDRGSGGVLLVAGEPGIGKTRLLGELCARGRDRGHLVLAGRAAQFERDLPFGLFAATLDDHLTSMALACLDGVGAAQAAELGRVFSSLGPLVPEEGEPVVLPVERYRAYRVARGLLETLSRSRPLVLALDDVHWADPASVELVCHLLARRSQAPVLLALAFRPAQVPAPLAAAFAAAVRDGAAERVEVGPLSPGEADQLVGAGVERDVREALYRHSGGNPFYLEQLVRGGGGERAVAGPALVGVDGVPPAVGLALASELDHLSGQARAMLRGGAVAGDPFEHDLAAQAGGLGGAEALQALDELLECGIVRPNGAPGWFQFRHPIVCAAVYSSAGAGWRLGAHARAAGALAARGAASPVLAHHVERSARPGDGAAVAVLAEAGRHVAPRAPVTAARWFAAALRLMADQPAATRLELLMARAAALGSAGQLEECHVVLCEALEVAGGEHGALRVRLIAMCANVERQLGRHQDSRNRLAHALRGLDDERSLEAAALLLELALDAFFACEFPTSRAYAARACAGAERLGDQGLALAATVVLGLTDYCTGDTTDARARIDEAAAVFDRRGDADLADRLDVAYYLGRTEQLLGRLDDAIRHLERGVAIARATGQDHGLMLMTMALALALALRGRLAEADELAESTVEAARVSANMQLLSWALWARAEVSIVADDPATAIAACAESFELTRALEPSVLSTPGGRVLGRALLEAGEAQRCRAETLADFDRWQPLATVAEGQCVRYELLTRAELALGDLEAAKRWAGRAQDLADRLALPVNTARVGRARAAVLLADGQADIAAETALASAAVADAAGARIDAARSRILAGQALARAGQRRPAVAQLELAEAELAACGAHRSREQAARELRRLGHRPRPSRATVGSPAAGPESLTRREREIAELVIEGKSNRAIAATVYISAKTVETHLSHIYAKLDVSSRAAMTARLLAHPSRVGNRR